MNKMMKKTIAVAMALTVLGGAQTSFTGYQPVGGITANAEDLELSAFDDESQGDWTYKL